MDRRKKDMSAEKTESSTLKEEFNAQQYLK